MHGSAGNKENYGRWGSGVLAVPATALNKLPKLLIFHNRFPNAVQIGVSLLDSSRECI
jgi:hypothetical protein